jgi:hypothetical protein
VSRLKGILYVVFEDLLIEALTKVIGSRFQVQARPGLRLVAYGSESATRLKYIKTPCQIPKFESL